MTEPVVLLDDGTLTTAWLPPQYWEPEGTPGQYRCTLPPCRCRRFSYQVLRRQVTIQVHCFCKQVNCSAEACFACEAKVSLDQPLPRNKGHWLTNMKHPSIKGSPDPTRLMGKSKNDERRPPGLAKRAVTWLIAVAEWKAAGSPERTEDEVKQIYKQFCEPCSQRNKRTNICRGCGCHVASKGHPILNKIKMATQHCLREFW